MICVEVEVEDERWRSAAPSVEAIVSAAIALALASDHDGGVTVLLASDPTVHDLNLRFLGKDHATNVLSFPAPLTARPHLGDIALAYGVCSVEAEDQGKSLEHHLQHLAVHGALHLIGYDHQTEEDATIMEAKEREIMARLGAPDPYLESDRHTSSERHRADADN